MPRTLALARDEGLEKDVDVDDAVYFLSQITVVPGRAAGMPRWRKRLFVTLSRNAASPVEYFRLPADRTVAVGSQVEL